MGLEGEAATPTILVLSLSKDGSALHPWFDKLTMGLERKIATHTNFILSLSKDGRILRNRGSTPATRQGQLNAACCWGITRTAELAPRSACFMTG